MYVHLLTITILLFTGLINNSESVWKQELDKKGIQIYTRHVVGTNFKEFRGEIVLDGNALEIADIITDFEKYPEWCYKTKSVKLINKDGNIFRYFYVSETPGFLKTRVAYVESEMVSSTKNNTITLSLNNFQNNETIPANSLLIPVMKGFWAITPIEGNKVYVIMQMLSDPGGIIPAWLANMVVVDSPYVTLSNLRKRISKKSDVAK